MKQTLFSLLIGSIALSALMMMPGAAHAASHSAKKGLGIVAARDAQWLQKAQALHIHWFYTWGWDKPADQPADLTFVPMIWGYYGNPDGKTARGLDALKAQTDADALLGFNEPDGKDQANLPVAQALDAWPLLMHTGLRLGSPAGVHPDGSWMTAFMQGVQARNYRVDFVTIHWYGGDDPQGFLAMLQRIHDLYHRPLWITEFAVADWQADATHPSRVNPAQVADFMRVVLPALDKLDYVQRYAWFSGSTSDLHLGASALWNDDGTLTALGRVYASF
jgi:hypothetical protein